MVNRIIKHLKRLKNIKIKHHVKKLKNIKISYHFSKIRNTKHIHKSSTKSKKFNVKFTHSGHHNVAMLVMVLAFFALLAPLAYTQLPTVDAGPKYDVVTGLAVSNTMEPSITTALLIIFAIAFLIPAELSLRKYQKSSKKKRK
ncbi:MAG: hypothetical protein V1870_05710 [Candidatus Aenigmatarchaeota archaeon]